MANVLILFSHKLTEEQEKDLKNQGVDSFIFMPENLKNLWGNVPPELKSLKDFSKNFIDWIKENSKEGDYLIIQGDYGLTNILVDFSFKNGLIPIYSTTERIHQDIKLPDGSVKIVKTFKHKIFRRYEKWED